MLHNMIDQAAYMAHGYCLLWKPWLIAMHAGSDFFIFIAYMAIPFAIWLFVKKRNDLELKPLALLFAAFIFLCGLSHAVQGLTLWWPVYETQGYVKVATAIVSVATAAVIFPLIPKALAIPSPRQLGIVNEGLATEVAAHRATLFELEKAKSELEMRVAERTKELEHSKARFEALVRASAQIVWTRDPRGELIGDCPSWREFTGQSIEGLRCGGWIQAVHPSDRNALTAAWQEALRTKMAFSLEYRLHHAELGYRWTAVKAVPLKTNGEVVEWVGMNTDVDERRRWEDHTQFVMKELSHRTKNLLTVIYSMARQSARNGHAGNFLADFSERIQGLSRSHDLLVSSNWMGVLLEEHLNTQLKPFIAAGCRQIRISGPSLMLGPAATQALGLAFHELATNAAKHGALAQTDGSIDIAWDVELKEAGDVFKLAWRERSHGSERNAEHKAGFGYVVLNRVVPDSLLGVVEYRMSDEGVSWQIEAPLHEVAPPSEHRPNLAI